jgi:hypothetical protein
MALAGFGIVMQPEILLADDVMAGCAGLLRY